jgi:hypothetical protein
MSSENENSRIIRDNDTAERFMSRIINRIPMRIPPEEKFSDVIRTTDKESNK